MLFIISHSYSVNIFLNTRYVSDIEFSYPFHICIAIPILQGKKKLLRDVIICPKPQLINSETDIQIFKPKFWPSSIFAIIYYCLPFWYLNMLTNVSGKKSGERKEKILKPSIYFLFYIPFPVLYLHLWGETQKLVGSLRMWQEIAGIRMALVINKRSSVLP